jgi:uncharacterized protein
MAEHPNIAAARASIEAFKSRDMDGFAAGVHDDAVWHAPGKNGFSGTFNGKGAIIQRFKDQAAAGVNFGIGELHDLVGSDEHVVALVESHVTGPGGEVKNPAVFVMHVRDGKLTEFWGMNEHQDEVDKVIDG